MTSFHNKYDLEQGCCLPLRICFLTLSDLLSALNETQLAPSHAGVWGKTVSFTVLQWDASVKTLCPWADILSQDVEGKGQFAWVVHHYSYLPAHFISFMNFDPVDSLGAGKQWHERLATTVRTELADGELLNYCRSRYHLKISLNDFSWWCKMPKTLFVDLDTEIFVKSCWVVSLNLIKCSRWTGAAW